MADDSGDFQGFRDAGAIPGFGAYERDDGGLMRLKEGPNAGVTSGSPQWDALGLNKKDTSMGGFGDSFKAFAPMALAAFGGGFLPGAEAFGGAAGGFGEGLGAELAYGAPELAGQFSLSGASDIASAMNLGGENAGIIGSGEPGVSQIGADLGNGVTSPLGGPGTPLNTMTPGTFNGQGPANWDAALQPGPEALPAGPQAATAQPGSISPQVGTTTPSATGMPVGTSGADVPGASQSTGGTPGTPGTPPTPPTSLPGTNKSSAAPAGMFDKAINSITSNPLGVAGLGVNVASAIAKKNSGDQLPAELRAAAKPAGDAANQLLQQGLSGTAPAAVVNQANQSLTDTIEQIKQRYAAMGRDPSKDSAAQQEIAKATERRDAAIFQASQQLLSQGLSAAGLAQGPTTQAAVAGAQQDKELSASMSNAMQQLAMLQAMQSKSA